MKHLNGNLLCAVTIAATGKDPIGNDLCAVCIAPLDNDFTFSASRPMFLMHVRHDHELRFDRSLTLEMRRDIVESMKYGSPPETVARCLEQWFDGLNLGYNKKIMPLAYNWPLVSQYLIDLLMWESFSQIFDWRFRDLLSYSICLNDRCDYQGVQYVTQKHGLQYLCNTYDAHYSKASDICKQAEAIVHTYKRLRAVHVGL